jgi:hypothetical protein
MARATPPLSSNELAERFAHGDDLPAVDMMVCLRAVAAAG